MQLHSVCFCYHANFGMHFPVFSVCIGYFSWTRYPHIVQRLPWVTIISSYSKLTILLLGFLLMFPVVVGWSMFFIYSISIISTVIGRQTLDMFILNWCREEYQIFEVLFRHVGHCRRNCPRTVVTLHVITLLVTFPGYFCFHYIFVVVFPSLI